MGNGLCRKVFWAEPLPGRDDVIGALRQGSCDVMQGRFFWDAARRYSEAD